MVISKKSYRVDSTPERVDSTPERVDSTPERKEAIYGRAQDKGLSKSKAKDLFGRALAEKGLFAWPRKGNNAQTFSTIEPPPPKSIETDTKKKAGRPKQIIQERAHTPPTPPTDGAQQAPVGGGCLLRVQPAEGLTQ